MLDRFWWSTFVYGVVGGVSRSVLDRMIAIERAMWDPVQPDQLFLISRSEPLRPEPTDLWPRWRDEYLRLSGEEQKNYPILVVPNESISEAQNRIVESL